MLLFTKKLTSRISCAIRIAAPPLHGAISRFAVTPRNRGAPRHTHTLTLFATQPEKPANQAHIHTHTPKNVYILVQLRARDKLYICIHVYILNAPRRMEMGQRNTPKNRGWYYLLPIYNVHMYLVNNKIIINNSNSRWRNEERAAPQQRQNDSERAILNTNWIDYHHQQSSSSCQIWRLAWPFWFHPNRNSNHSYPHHHHAYVQWRTMTAIHGLRVGWARRIAHMAW